MAAGAALRQGTKIVGTLITKAETLGRFARQAAPEVFAKNWISNSPLPVRCHRLRQVADDHLVEKNAERIDVRLNGRCAASDQFRRHIKARSRAAGEFRHSVGGISKAGCGDPCTLEGLAVHQLAYAEVGQANLAGRVANPSYFFDKHVGGLDVLVNDTDRVRDRQRRCDLSNDLKSQLHQHVVEAAARLDPIDQVPRRRVFELQVVGWPCAATGTPRRVPRRDFGSY